MEYEYTVGFEKPVHIVWFKVGNELLGRSDRSTTAADSTRRRVCIDAKIDLPGTYSVFDPSSDEYTERISLFFIRGGNNTVIK